MTYSRSPSDTKKAPSVARSHAAASLRVFATAASCSLPRILTTLECASKSASASAMARRYRCRALGLSVRKCARSITAVSVSSAEGAGSSPIGMDWSARLLGMAAPVVAPQRPDAITHGQAFPRKGKSCRTFAVKYVVHKREKAGLEPDPSLCCLTVSGRASLQGAGNLWRLPEGFGAATPSRFRKPVGSPVHNLTRRKVHGYELAHVRLSPVAALVERHPVSAT